MRGGWAFVVSIAGILLSTTSATPATVRISNLEPKRDVNGDIVNGHDGTYRFFDGHWYYHAAEYGLCREPPRYGCDSGHDHKCGFHGDHNVSIWRSPDLSSGSWKRVGTAAHCATDVPNCGILYRPHLVQHPTSMDFLLYVNYVRKDGGYGGNAVFRAERPEGPFSLVNPVMNLSRLCPGPAAMEPCGETQGGAGDFDVFVDPADGAAYIAYSAKHWLSVESLTPDMLSTTGVNASWVGGAFGGSISADYFVEAPAMFVRQGTYYLLYGHCCCFCYQVDTKAHTQRMLTHSHPCPFTPSDCSHLDICAHCPALSKTIS